jgi:RNA polymerase sigma-70 factor (ECF subfamily)
MADPQNKSPAPDPATSTSRSLLAGVRANDPAAWDRLVELYAPLVLHWCRRAALRDDRAADVFQDVFGAAAANIHRFRKRGPDDSFRAWLRTITRRKIIDHISRAHREPDAVGGTAASMRLAQIPIEPVEPIGAIEDDVDRTAFSGVLQRAMERVRPEVHEQTWSAFWNVVVEGRAATDVAGELGMSAGAVRVAKSRVLQRLRAELGELPE